VIARAPFWRWSFAAATAASLGAIAAPSQASEAERILEALALRPGQVVADVGAGHGEWTEHLARRVGAAGHVWATEVEAPRLESIATRLRDAGLDNVTAVLGDQRDTGLPESCCDAILLRLVYHHFTDPAPMRASLRRALRPGGRLVVVDTGPRAGWPKLAGVPKRGGHGIREDDLIADLVGDGFVLLERHDRWESDEAQYCAVFTRPAEH